MKLVDVICTRVQHFCHTVKHLHIDQHRQHPVGLLLPADHELQNSRQITLGTSKQWGKEKGFQLQTLNPFAFQI